MKGMRQVWMTEDGWIAEHDGDDWSPIGKLDNGEIRAAMQALCEEAEDGYPDGFIATVPTGRLRALLAGDDAALREVKHAVWCEAYYTGVDDTVTSHDFDHFQTPPNRVSPYRDTAGEAD